MAEDKVYTDYSGRENRLTAEREAHILQHPEMKDQMDKIVEVIQNPEFVVQSIQDSPVVVYPRLYLTYLHL